MATTLVFRTTPGAVSIPVGQSKTLGAVDVHSFDRIRVVADERVGSDAVYGVPGNKLTIFAGASGSSSVDVLVYGSARGPASPPPPQRNLSPARGRGARFGCPPDILPLTRPARIVSFRLHNREGRMATNQTYVKTEVVGSSDKSVSDAIEFAIAVASRSLRNLAWFEVIDVRGSIHDNKVSNYQVTLKLGLKYEPKA